MVYLYFNKKMKEFSSPVFYFFLFTDFPRFQGPVRAMYQSVGKCFRMHLKAASIYKFSGDPSPIFRVSAGALTDTLTF